MSANRGKYAEAKVRIILKEIEEENLRFTFNRIQDAHAARGVFASQAGDFEWFFDTGKIAGLPVDGGGSIAVPFTLNGVLEVKETEHAFRLAHKNFSADKVARMRKRQLAGSQPLVLICHRVYGGDTPTVWRPVEFDYFLQREGGSWDLSDWPTYTQKELPALLRQLLLNP